MDSGAWSNAVGPVTSFMIMIVVVGAIVVLACMLRLLAQLWLSATLFARRRRIPKVVDLHLDRESPSTLDRVDARTASRTIKTHTESYAEGFRRRVQALRGKGPYAKSMDRDT